MGERLNVLREHHVWVVEMSRAPTNYLDADLIADLSDVYSDADASRSCRAVVLCSTTRHFCPGADLDSTFAGPGRKQAMLELYDQAERLLDGGVPVVAAVNGAAIGGGLGLACTADFRVASPRSRFHANFAALGFHHGFGLTVSLPEIIGSQKAAELLLTARAVYGAEALTLGLVDRCVPPGDERTEAFRLAARIAENAPLAIRAMRTTLRDSTFSLMKEAIAIEAREQARLWQTADSKAGIAASIAGESPEFSGK